MYYPSISKIEKVLGQLDKGLGKQKNILNGQTIIIMNKN